MNINWNFLEAVHWADVGATLTIFGIIIVFLTVLYAKDQKRSDEKISDISKKIDEKNIDTKNVVKQTIDGAVEKIKMIYQHQETLYNLHHEQNEDTHNKLIEGLNIVTGTLSNVKDQLKEYSIINHDVYDHELNDISLSSKLCTLEIINMCIEQSLGVKNKNKTNHEEFFTKLRLFTSDEKVKHKAGFIVNGISNRLVGIWEETLTDTISLYETWISSRYFKLQTLTGNGSLDKLIQDSWMDLGREIDNDFMKRILKKLVLKQEIPEDPISWDNTPTLGTLEDWANRKGTNNG